jgi:hypothetical protein
MMSIIADDLGIDRRMLLFGIWTHFRFSTDCVCTRLNHVLNQCNKFLFRVLLDFDMPVIGSGIKYEACKIAGAGGGGGVLVQR